MWAFAVFTFVSQVVLLGVLGHFESAPSVSNINIADSLFMASLAIVGFQIIIATTPVTYFGRQFLAIVTESLQELEKVSTDNDERTAPIKLIIGKVWLIIVPPFFQQLRSDLNDPLCAFRQIGR